jgi:hypothetical protein
MAENNLKDKAGMKPIIFSTPMVKAILEGRKTQTRRVIEPQPVTDILGMQRWRAVSSGDISQRNSIILDYAPYQPGDILWVREMWRCIAVGKGGQNEVAIIEYKNGQQAVFDVDSKEALYFAGKARWKPSSHMPRKLSRLLLEVKGVRAERLRDISEEDAKAEGVSNISYMLSPNEVVRLGESAAVTRFCSLWDTLNARRGFSWDSNPWVWVIEFERIEKNDL